MRADNIQNIISNINELPYKAILFDGVWITECIVNMHISQIRKEMNPPQI